MAKLSWDKPGERFFETGVDRGVLYPFGAPGVAWNGLVGLTETPSGGEATGYYVDGMKYYNESSLEEYEATLEAYTYPREFGMYDGSSTSETGLEYPQQDRYEFGLSYRTLVGNDLEGTEHRYKIHLLYKALASPSQRNYATVSENPDIAPFSWSISATPERIPSKKPTAVLTIDTSLADPTIVDKLELILYGGPYSSPRLPGMTEVITMFDDWSPLMIYADNRNGLSELLYNDVYKDLKGDNRRGLYTAHKLTRLTETNIDGLYRL